MSTERAVPRALALLLALLALSACRVPPAVSQARTGDFAAVRETLSGPEGERTDAARLAREVLAYEIRAAKEIEDRAFIASLGPCAADVERPLLARSKTRDAIGGEALLVLYEANRYRGPRPKRFQSSPEGAFRALAARDTATDHAQRVAYFVDDDERVRQAALEAAVDAKDERDIPALLEASRLDPSPYIRSRAFYALGQLGGERVHHALLDRLTTAPPELQLSVLDALAQPDVAKVDGSMSLLHLAEKDRGLVGLHAAYLLSSGPRRPDASPEDAKMLRQTGTLRLIAFAEGGTEEEQRLALRLLPTDSPATESILLRASGDPNPEVRVIAWARLLGRPKHRPAAEQALLALAKERDRVAYQARSALAAGGSLAVLEYFQAQAKAPQVELRLLAGRAFIRLERERELAPLLADPATRVRRSLACARLARDRIAGQ